MKTKGEGSTSEEHGNHLSILRKKRKPEETKNQTLFWDPYERGGHRANHGPEETEKGTQGTELS